MIGANAKQRDPNRKYWRYLDIRASLVFKQPIGPYKNRSYLRLFFYTVFFFMLLTLFCKLTEIILKKSYRIKYGISPKPYKLCYSRFYFFPVFATAWLPLFAVLWVNAYCLLGLITIFRRLLCLNKRFQTTSWRYKAVLINVILFFYLFGKFKQDLRLCCNVSELE